MVLRFIRKQAQHSGALIVSWAELCFLRIHPLTSWFSALFGDKPLRMWSRLSEILEKIRKTQGKEGPCEGTKIKWPAIRQEEPALLTAWFCLSNLQNCEGKLSTSPSLWHLIMVAPGHLSSLVPKSIWVQGSLEKQSQHRDYTEGEVCYVAIVHVIREAGKSKSSRAQCPSLKAVRQVSSLTARKAALSCFI